MKDLVTPAGQSKPSGPPEMAFPLIGAIPLNPLNPNHLQVFLQGGMTLRDYFAGQYITSIPHLGELGPGVTFKMVAADIAMDAYDFADAMIAERSKHGS